MRKFMHLLAKLFPSEATGEHPFAVSMFYRLSLAKGFLKRIKVFSAADRWPVCPGNFHVINPNGQVAVCTLTSDNLIPFEHLPQNVSLIGSVMTPNLGIEQIIRNTISNPNIRYLVVCGKDSPVFKPGQALCFLFKFGVDNNRRIIHAEGHFPVLKNLKQKDIDIFLQQIELCMIPEDQSPDKIWNEIAELSVKPKSFIKDSNVVSKQSEFQTEQFIELKAGGRRIPLSYDSKGFFVINVYPKRGEIQVNHYYKDSTSGFYVRGRSGEAILLAILDKNLVSQMSHAGYLGAELAKAETAVRLGLEYVQDRPLKA